MRMLLRLFQLLPQQVIFSDLLAAILSSHESQQVFDLYLFLALIIQKSDWKAGTLLAP